MAYDSNLLISGWVQEGSKYLYSYINPDLSCGKGHNVPPMIVCTSNFRDYGKIEDAEVTFSEDEGGKIIFTTEEPPTANIGIIIIDMK